MIELFQKPECSQRRMKIQQRKGRKKKEISKGKQNSFNLLELESLSQCLILGSNSVQSIRFDQFQFQHVTVECFIK